ncbi:MAG: response regulator [Sandaracinaceae bacterium]
MTPPIRVLLVDDQALFCEGMRALLDAYDEVEVVGQAHDGGEGVRMAAELDADVVLMDLAMPRVDGVTAIRQLNTNAPGIRVIALTTFEDDDSVVEAVRAGALGYLLKDCDADTLVDAVRSAARGEPTLAPSATRAVLAELRREAPAPPPGALALSPREREVLALLCRSATNREIARALFIAEGTVKNHLTHIFEKLGVSDRTQAALRAKEWRLI